MPSRNYRDQSGFAHFLVLILLFLSIGVGIYLVQSRTNFLPQAADVTTSDEVELVSNQLLIKFKPSSKQINAFRVGSNEDSGVDSLNQIIEDTDIISLEPTFAKVPTTAKISADQSKAEQELSSWFLATIDAPSEIVKSRIGGTNILKTNSAQATKLQALIDKLESDPNVEIVQPNYVVTATVIPNDKEYSRQWALPKIEAPQAWDITTGTNQIKVAVLDTGIDYTHPDLGGDPALSNQFPNKRVVSGYNFMTYNDDPMDKNGHGTHVAGIIGAVTNNSIGVSGLNWNVSLEALKVLDDQGGGTLLQIGQAIEHAATYGAKVINLSLSSRIACHKNSYTQAAINYANSKNVTIVASAGNSKIDVKDFTPASCEHVIAVAATGSDDARATYSNYGSGIDIAAPGGDCTVTTEKCSIFSTFKYHWYTGLEGTSMAAPFVTGAAALLLSKNPELTPYQIEKILKESSDPITTDKYIGGRLNVYKALTAAIPSPTPTPSPSIIPSPSPYIDWWPKLTAGGSLVYPDIGSGIIVLKFASNNQAVLPIEIQSSYNSKKSSQLIFEKSPIVYHRATEPSPYKLTATCDLNGVVKVNWTKQDDLRYRALMFDCTDEATPGSCEPSTVVGATEYSGADVSVNASYIVEALPDGNTQKLTNLSGNFERNPNYNLFRTQHKRHYVLQLYERNLDDTNPHAVEGVVTSQFMCTNPQYTFSKSPQYPTPNTLGIEVACQKDGAESSALWWSLGKNNASVDNNLRYRAIVYDCTFDKTTDCSDPAKSFVAGETPFVSMDQVVNGQKFMIEGKTLITRPGHRYQVRVVGTDLSGSAASRITKDVVVQAISCR